MKKFVLLLSAVLLYAGLCHAQTVAPIGIGLGGSGGGGGGSGCTVSGGSANQILVNNGSNGCTSNANASANAGALSLGASGTLGQITLGNASSGTINLQPVTGALGSINIVFPATSGTVALTSQLASLPLSPANGGTGENNGTANLTLGASLDFTHWTSGGAGILNGGSGSTLAIGGATIGSNAFAVTGTSLLSGNTEISAGSSPSFPTQASLSIGGTQSNSSFAFGIELEGSYTSTASQVFAMWMNPTLFPASGQQGTFFYAGGKIGTGASNVIASAYGGYVAPVGITGGGSITTLYGMYINPQANGGTNWTLYSAGGNNQFVGSIYNSGIASDTGLTDATVCEDTTNHKFWSGSGTLGICLGTSSLRYKHDVAALDVGLSQIMKLQPIRYKLNADHGDPNKLMYGFSAEQGQTALPVLTGKDVEGRPNTFDYLGVVPVLVRAIQQQQAEIDSLKRKMQ